MPFTRTLAVFSRKKIFAIKVDPLNLESQNQAKNIPIAAPRFPNQTLRQIGPGVPELWSDKQTNRQTAEITTLYI